MGESTSDHADDKGQSPVPRIPECDVDRNKDGTYRLRHKRTGDTETAATEQDAEMKGIVLRVSAALGREIPFTTGDRL